MPFMGRDPKYPLYPQFGDNPAAFTNVLALTFEQDAFTPGQTLEWQVKTGSAEIRVYDQIIEFIEGEVDFTALEGVTCTDGVTPIVPGNADRNSTFVSSVTAYLDPTGITGGVVLRGFEHYGLASPIIGLGDHVPESLQYVTLKFNTNYIFKFVNVSPETIIDFRYVLLWVE